MTQPTLSDSNSTLEVPRNNSLQDYRIIAASVGLWRRQITRDKVTEQFVVPQAERGNVP